MTLIYIRLDKSQYEYTNVSRKKPITLLINYNKIDQSQNCSIDLKRYWLLFVERFSIQVACN